MISDPYQYYSICSAIPYKNSGADKGKPYGKIQVLQSSNFTLEGELVQNVGGCSKYPWAIGEGDISASISLAMTQFEPFMYELFLGKAPTENASETTGDVGTLTDTVGTSITDGTDGITVTATSSDESDLKFGDYLVEAVTATTIDVYYIGQDLANGTDGEYFSNTLKVTENPIDVSTSAELANFGLTFAPSSTTDLTVGDKATFTVRSINERNFNAIFGANTDEFPEFGIKLLTPFNNGYATIIDVFSCKAVGMPHNFERNTYTGTEVTLQAFYNSSKGGVFDIKTISKNKS